MQNSSDYFAPVFGLFFFRGGLCAQAFGHLRISHDFQSFLSESLQNKLFDLQMHGVKLAWGWGILQHHDLELIGYLLVSFSDFAPGSLEGGIAFIHFGKRSAHRWADVL